MTRVAEEERQRPRPHNVPPVRCPICPLETNTIGITAHWNWHVRNGDGEGMICCYCTEVFPDRSTLMDHRLEVHENPLKRPHPKVENTRAARYRQVEEWSKLPYRQFRDLVEDRSLWRH